MPEVRQNPSKWANRSAAASGEYASGVASPRRPWDQATAAAESNYEQGVNASIAAKSFGKGVAAAGNAKWQKGVAEKGRSRYQTGVATAQNEYQAGFAPYADVIRGVTLAPRGPKGTNYGRVQTIGDALHARKMQK